MSSPSRKFCADAGTVPADSAARQVTPSINRYRDFFVMCGFIRVNMLLLSVKFGSMVAPLRDRIRYATLLLASAPDVFRAPCLPSASVERCAVPIREIKAEIPGAGRQFEPLNSVNLEDRKSTRLNSSHLGISYAVFCL